MGQSGRQSVAKLVEYKTRAESTTKMSDDELITAIESYKSMSNLQAGEAATFIAYLRVYGDRHSWKSKFKGYTALLGELESKYIPKPNR